jgi:hypothetical protein
MPVKTVEIIETAPTKIWLRKYDTGSISVIVQHQGCDEFKHCTFDYDYRYTCNSTIQEQAEKMARELGAGDEVEIERFSMTDGLLKYIESTSEEDIERDKVIHSLKTEIEEFTQFKMAMNLGLPIWPTKWTQDTAALAFQIHNLGYQPANNNEMVLIAIKEGYAPWLIPTEYELNND